jgi:hypothetical protein
MTTCTGGPGRNALVCATLLRPLSIALTLATLKYSDLRNLRQRTNSRRPLILPIQPADNIHFPLRANNPRSRLP